MGIFVLLGKAMLSNVNVYTLPDMDGIAPTIPVATAKPSPLDASCCFIAYNPGVPSEASISELMGSFIST